VGLSFLYQVVVWLLTAYQMVLFVRVVLSWVVSFNPDWTPRGPLLVISELVYSLTDPPLRLVRKVVKPLRLGQVALDLSVLVLFVILMVLGSVIGLVFSALIRL
jgi:YggT family protein